MKWLSFSLIGCLALSLTGCQELYEVYIRNATTQPAVVDVYLFEKSGLKVLPNRVKMAKQALDLKSKVRKYMTVSQAVKWVDTNHFQIDVLPNTTVDLTEMEHLFRGYDYSAPRPSISVTITINNKIDTLMNKDNDFSQITKFKYIVRIPLSPSYHYYDVGNMEVLPLGKIEVE